MEELKNQIDLCLFDEQDITPKFHTTSIYLLEKILYKRADSDLSKQMINFIIVCNMYRDAILAAIIQKNLQNEMLFDYCRLKADEEMLTLALMHKHPKLIAICLLRVESTKKLRQNCPAELKYLVDRYSPN